MKALVTGGAGFIGTNIVRKLYDDGYLPVVLDDFSSGYRENLLHELPIYEADVCDFDQVVLASQDCGVIFHLAASVGNKRSIDDPISDSRTNILGMLSVLEAARLNGISRVVYSSSAGIFGELISLPISEEHPQVPDSPYGVSKLAAEKMCLVYNKLYGMNNICLRYFNVYGPYQRYDSYGNVIPIFARRLLKQEPLIIFGDGEQTRDFINVKDVAIANIKAAFANGNINGTFNIGSNTRISINELANFFCDIAGFNTEIQYHAPRQGDVRDSLADINKARIFLDFEPVIPLKEGLTEYWQWFIEDKITRKQIIESI